MKCWLHEPKKQPTRRHDTVVIAGDGKSLVKDLDRIAKLEVAKDNYSIGRSYRHFLMIDHWGTVDGELSIWWAENIPGIWRNGKQRHTLGKVRGFDFDWDSYQPNFDDRGNKWWGSSSLFAVLTSLAMGYSRIILAGCPLDSEGHWYSLEHEKGPAWDEEDFKAWREFKNQPGSTQVKSCSGFTRKLLGEPSKQWLISSQR